MRFIEQAPNAIAATRTRQIARPKSKFRLVCLLRIPGPPFGRHAAAMAGIAAPVMQGSAGNPKSASFPVFIAARKSGWIRIARRTCQRCRLRFLKFSIEEDEMLFARTKSGLLASLAVLLIGAVAAGCSIKFPAPIAFDAPAKLPADVAQLPVKIGIHYPEKFRTKIHKGVAGPGARIVLPIGAAAGKHFDGMFAAMFRETVPVKKLSAPASAGVAAIIVANLEEVHYVHPAMFRGRRAAAVSLGYRFTIHAPDGKNLGSWVVGATGRGSASSGETNMKAAGQAAAAALRMISTKFLAEFNEVPEVRKWKRSVGISPARDMASDHLAVKLSAAKIELLARPILENEKQQDLFKAGLNKARILPVEVKILNGGRRPIVVRYMDMTINEPGKPVIRSAGLAAVVKRVTGRRQSFASSMMFTGAILGTFVAAEENRQRTKRTTHLEAKKFKDVILAPGANAAGLAYFVLPKKGRRIGSGVLKLRIVDQLSALDFVVSQDLGNVAPPPEPEPELDGTGTPIIK